MRSPYTTMVSNEEIISVLIDFELERTDALLYIALLQTGASTVNTIATKLEIDKGKVYRSLHKLQALGLVSSTFSNPTICHAIDPEKALMMIIQNKEEKILCMQKSVKKIVEDIGKFKNPHETISQVPSFYIIQGRPNIYFRIGKLIEETIKTVYIVTTVRDLLRMNYTAIPDKIKICKNNHGEVRIITDVGKDRELLTQVGGLESLESLEVRLTALPSNSRIIVSQDGRLLMSGSMGESMSLNDETDSTLYTNSQEMVGNLLSFCTHLWDISKPLKFKSVLGSEMTE